jgi:hypothetical protein
MRERSAEFNQCSNVTVSISGAPRAGSGHTMPVQLALVGPSPWQKVTLFAQIGGKQPWRDRKNDSAPQPAR